MSFGGSFVRRTVRIADGNALDIHSDCDSEGNDPPQGVVFVPPEVAELATVAIAPPRAGTSGVAGAAASGAGGERELAARLPYAQPAPRVRYSEQFASRISYEDWVNNDTTDPSAVRLGRRARQSHRRDVRKLEDDSDLPVGQPYFWHAFCATCSRSFHPHVPSAWQCPTCRGRVWQQPEDPESKACAVCHRKMARIVTVGGHRVRNPMALNAHMCKRCGRAVCDECYAPTPQVLDEFGYRPDDPQRVCTQCVGEMAQRARPPEEEDLGTLHDEHVLAAVVDEAAMLRPFWPPQCGSCNSKLARPPPRWECLTCGALTWQPESSPLSRACWICSAPGPKCRCHRCGQLVCAPCGAYAQPLPALGFTSGTALSVCKCCYEGLSCSVAPPEARAVLQREVDERVFAGACPMCNARNNPPGPAGVPPEWLSRCHRRPTWQPEAKGAPDRCAVCTAAAGEGGRFHCARCGRIVCVTCAQYREPVPERGFPKGVAQLVCRACFDPRAALLPDHLDTRTWPAECLTCGAKYATPPDRWRCYNNCGNVWQPLSHVASRACYCCGKATGNAAVNCRCCGRVVCGAACGAGRAEVPERGFTRGMVYPRCAACMPSAPQPGAAAAAASSGAPNSRGSSPTGGRGRGAGGAAGGAGSVGRGGGVGGGSFAGRGSGASSPGAAGPASGGRYGTPNAPR